MKLIRPSAQVLLCALCASFASAQTVSPPPAAKSDAAADAKRPTVVAAAETATPADDLDRHVVTLSPFVVNAEQDTGYQAQSTLAGSRLATPLKDLGASISVYTKDFMNDIGAVSATDLLVYATGMDVAGSQANFSGGTNNLGEAQVLGDGPRTSSQGVSRTRGLAGPEYTRGYFSTSIGYDGYNTSATTVIRGPNAVLFGAGSPAGVVDSTPVDAELRRNSIRIENRVGDNGALRNTFNLNHIIWKDKLAVRLIALQDDERYDQRPAYENKSRIYGAMTFTPARSTRLRAKFESGNTRANRPIGVLPFDSSRPFLADGAPVFDWTLYDDPSRNAAAAATNAHFARPRTIGQAQLFDVVVIPFAVGGGAPSLGFRGQQPAGNNRFDYRSTMVDSNINRDGAADTIQFYETFNIGEGGLPASFFPGGLRPVGLKQQGFTDYEAFAFNKRMIDSTSFQNDSFKSLTLNFEQSGWKDRNGQDRIGVELAYHMEKSSTHWLNSFFSQANGNHVRIDPNVTLTDGRPNPNVGRPYVAGGNNADNRFGLTEREQRRATAFIRYDFKDSMPEWGQWLGRHTLTGLVEETGGQFLRYDKRQFIFGPLAERLSPNNPTAFARRANFLAYIGPSVLTTGGKLVLDPIQNVDLQIGAAPVSAFINNSIDPTVNGAIGTETVGVVPLLNGTASMTRSLLSSKAAVLQSYMLKDLLITTVGVRKDSQYQTRVPNLNYANYPTWDGTFTIDEFNLPRKGGFVDSGTTRSYGGVLRWPQMLMRLPQGVDANVFYNKSDNFSPSGNRANVYGDLLASPKGKTEEYGFSLSLFDEKLYLRVANFETSVVGQSFNSQAYTNAYNNGVRQTAESAATERQRNPTLDRTAQINDYRAAVPEYFDIIQFTLVGDGTPGNPYSYTDVANPPGVTDTTDFTAKGTEFELVYNPTRNWRILVNVSKQETTQTNLAPLTKEFVERMIPVWEKWKDVPQQGYPIGWQPGDPITNTVGTFITNNVLVPYATLLAQEGQVSAEQRKWRANLVTNYTFNEGRLKGFGIGTGVRWQDKYAIGYPTSQLADKSIFVDIQNPYYGPSETNIDAWISYKRKLLGGKIDWQIQLNAKNLFGETDPIAINTHYNGAIAQTRLPPEKRIYLSNTFSF